VAVARPRIPSVFSQNRFLTWKRIFVEAE